MKNISKIFLFLLVFGVTLQIISCEAPIENPLDPMNPNNKLSSIQGTVKRESFPNLPIDNVEVFWRNDNKISYTDIDGKFTLQNLKRYNGWLIFSQDGYSRDSLFIEWDEKKSILVTVLLNSKPVSDSIQLYSIVENTFQIIDNYRLFCGIRVKDPDGPNDIAAAFVEIPELDFKYELSYDVETKFYSRTIKLDNLSSLETLIGKQVYFSVSDLDNREFTAGTTTLKRIINTEAQAKSPINNEEVERPFSLEWIRYTPGFEFHYMMEIYTDTSPADLVWQKDNIPSTEITTPVDTTIFPGEYFWVIWVVDEFNNRSRSTPASFEVK